MYTRNYWGTLVTGIVLGIVASKLIHYPISASASFWNWATQESFLASEDYAGAMIGGVVTFVAALIALGGIAWQVISTKRQHRLDDERTHLGWLQVQSYTLLNRALEAFQRKKHLEYFLILGELNEAAANVIGHVPPDQIVIEAEGWKYYGSLTPDNFEKLNQFVRAEVDLRAEAENTKDVILVALANAKTGTISINDGSQVGNTIKELLGKVSTKLGAYHDAATLLKNSVGIVLTDLHRKIAVELPKYRS